MEKTKKENISLLALTAAVSVLLYFVFAPFLLVFAFAAAFAILLRAPYARLTKLFGGSASAGALGTVVLMLVFVIVPLFFLGVQVFGQAQGLYALLHGNEVQYLHTLEKAIETPVQQLFPGFAFDLGAYAGSALLFISNNLGSLIYQTISVVFTTFLMLVALFFFLRDGRSFVVSLEEMSPLGSEATKNILSSMHQTIKSVVRGTLLIVLIRSVLIWAALTLFGIPNAILWGSVGGVIGAIPGLGTAAAFIAAVAYQYLFGSVSSAIALALVGTGVVVLVDNILTSYLFGKGLEVSPVFVLFSILGGLVFFGPLGFILGPLVLSVFLSVVREYR